MPGGDVSEVPWRRTRVSPLGFSLVIKIICGGFGFPCLTSWQSEPGCHRLLLFCVVIVHIPFRPHQRPLVLKCSPGGCSRGHLWGGRCRGVQASNTDQSNSESLHTPNVISPLEGCHVFFYFKVSVPLMSPSSSLGYCVVWLSRCRYELLELECLTSDPGFVYANCLMMGKWLNLMFAYSL